MKINLPDLPYELDSLEPYISEETLKYHYLKHHNGYVEKTNKLVRGTLLEGLSVEEIIDKSRADTELKNIFNVAAQIWNHSLYWHSMKKNGGGQPSDDLAVQIRKDFVTYRKFCDEFKKSGVSQFGSGYAWLIYSDGKLKIVSTTDAEIPVRNLDQALLNMDVWEHAYYIDYRNERGKYIDVFLDHLINWENASIRFNSLMNK